MDRGNIIEPKIRALYELMTGIDYPVSLVMMSDYDFIRASLDGGEVVDVNGLPTYKSIIEIKLMGKEDHDNAIKGIAPEKYIPQVQHQLMVTGASVCYLLCYLYTKGENDISPKNLVVVEILPDENYMANLLFKEIEFWDHVTKKKPVALSAKDFKRLDGFANDARKYLTAKRKIKELTEKMEEIKSAMIMSAELLGHPRYKCGNLKLVQSSRIGNIDYKKVPELKGIDLDQYRGKGSISWTITENKPDKEEA